MKVIISEKPSVARDIAAVIGQGSPSKSEGYFQMGDLVFTWAFGHLLELVNPEEYNPEWKQWRFGTLPMIPEDYNFQEKPIRDASKQLKVITGLYKTATEIVNACDAGREGELIFWRIARRIGWGRNLEPGKPGDRNASRMWLNSMTPGAIKKAWEDREPISLPKYTNLASSSYARAEADWILGLNMTRASSLAFHRPSDVKVWSVGRVQTPVLAEIVRRDLTIENFNPEPFWTVPVSLHEPEPFKAILDVPDTAKTLGDRKDRFASQEDADHYSSMIAGKNLSWDLRDHTKEKKERPPKLFSLTSLQRTCSQVFGWTAKKTLSVAQECYEKEKTLTYPRTESEFLPDDYVDTAHSIFESLTEFFGNELAGVPIISPRDSEQSWHFNSAKVSDHFAIVPTGNSPSDSPTKATSDTAKLWNLVAGRFLSAFGDTALAAEVSRVLTCAETPEPLTARCSGKTYTKKGWLEIAQALGVTGNRKETVLPIVEDSCISFDATTEKGETKPPAPYNESSILAMMENVATIFDQDEEEHGENISDLKKAVAARGLGTPATRADIIETLVQRNYVVREKKSLRATANGTTLIKNLRSHDLDSLTRAETTADWELKLKDIESGENNRRDFLDELSGSLREMIGKLAGSAESNRPDPAGPTDHPCPKTGDPVIDQGNYYTYPGYPELRCWKTIASRAITLAEWDAIIAAAETGEESPVMEGFLSKKKQKFDAMLKLDLATNKASFAFPENSGGGGFRNSDTSAKCPRSGEPVTESPKAYSFPGWPDIPLWKEISGRKMSLEDYLAITAAWHEGIPSKLYSFKSRKTKKTFKARLAPGNGKMEMKFDN